MSDHLAVADAAAGASIVAMGLLARRRHSLSAALAFATAIAWFAAAISPSLTLVHRPLMLATIITLAPGLARRLDAMVALAVCSLTLVAPVSILPWATAATGLLCMVVAARLADRPTAVPAPITTVASRSLLVLGIGFLLPEVERLVWRAYAEAGLAVFTYLIAVAVCMLLVVWALRVEADAVVNGAIALPDLTPTEALAQLHGLAAEERRPRRQQALVRAAQLLEDNLRLQAELASHVEDVRASRARLMDAAEAEQRRLEQVLAEGAGAYLAEIEQCLTATTAFTSGEPALSDCLVKIERTREDLDQIARGAHPRLLTEHGLSAALEELGRRSPVPLEVSAPARRFAETTEQALWYACAEAVSNVWKHSSARWARVRVSEAGATVHATIEDDGVGGAELTPEGGLAGLRDRLAVLDGRLQVSSTAEGTTVDITVPVR